MNASDRVKGDNNWHIRKLNSKLLVIGAMGSTGQSKLEIRVEIDSNKPAAQ